jgi:hypothetical protein
MRNANVLHSEVLISVIKVVGTDGYDVPGVSEQALEQYAYTVVIVDFDVGHDRIGLMRRVWMRGRRSDGYSRTAGG